VIFDHRASRPRLRGVTTRPTATDPFVDYAATVVREASPHLAVVEQPASRFLDNHVGVRHASALFTAAYEAARGLLAAALGGFADCASVHLVECEVEYVAVAMGAITTTAEPAGDGWSSLADDVVGPSCVDLDVAVVATNDKGRTVLRVTQRWHVDSGGFAF
jgi:hypothetical protein